MSNLSEFVARAKDMLNAYNARVSEASERIIALNGELQKAKDAMVSAADADDMDAYQEAESRMNFLTGRIESAKRVQVAPLFASAEEARRFQNEYNEAYRADVRNACRDCLGVVSNPNIPFTVSLDAPISTDDLTIADTIPDESAAMAMESAEDALYNQQLRELINDALDRLPDEISVTIRLHDLEGLSLQETADRQGISINTAKTKRKSGFYHMRRRQDLRSWYVPNYHRHKGLAAFKSSWSSAVEDEVIRKLD